MRSRVVKTSPVLLSARMQNVALKTFSEIGHRQSYEQVLAVALREVGLRLKADPANTIADFFPMLDDNKVAFCLMAIRNAAAGRPTVGLFSAG